MSLPLERVQSDFSVALIDPARADRLLASLARLDARTLERIALYRGNVIAAREKALANAYPVVRALVGDEFFCGLARAYGRAHPSRSGDLNAFGERFAGFVSAFEHARSLPCLGDVAALEWSVHRAHYAADADPLARDRLAALAAYRLLGTRFSLHPACAWIVSAFPVASLWRAHQSGAPGALPETVERQEFAIVVRPRWRVDVLVSSAGEIAALEQLRRGAHMGCAIGAALDAERGFDFARALVRWIDHSIIVDMDSGMRATAGSA